MTKLGFQSRPFSKPIYPFLPQVCLQSKWLLGKALESLNLCNFRTAYYGQQYLAMIRYFLIAPILFVLQFSKYAIPQPYRTFSYFPVLNPVSTCDSSLPLIGNRPSPHLWLTPIYPSSLRLGIISSRKPSLPVPAMSGLGVPPVCSQSSISIHTAL